jgi:hypothetical protein
MVCAACTSAGSGSRRSGGHTGHSLCSLAQLEELLREKAVSLRNLIQPACEVRLHRCMCTHYTWGCGAVSVNSDTVHPMAVFGS